MTKNSVPNATTKIRRLAQIAADLRVGHTFPITRLTTIKSLCTDPDAAARFSHHIAKLTACKMEHQQEPTPPHWTAYIELVTEAITHMERYLQNPTTDIDPLRNVLVSLQQVQNTYKNITWGPVRIIESRDVLVVEDAVQCLLKPAEAAYWAYHVARDYAERYDPRYGSGLIPESASMVEEIADFWCQYYFGKPLQEWEHRS